MVDFSTAAHFSMRLWWQRTDQEALTAAQSQLPLSPTNASDYDIGAELIKKTVHVQDAAVRDVYAGLAVTFKKYHNAKRVARELHELLIFTVKRANEIMQAKTPTVEKIDIDNLLRYFQYDSMRNEVDAKLSTVLTGLPKEPSKLKEKKGVLLGNGSDNVQKQEYKAKIALQSLKGAQVDFVINQMAIGEIDKRLAFKESEALYKEKQKQDRLLLEYQQAQQRQEAAQRQMLAIQDQRARAAAGAGQHAQQLLKAPRFQPLQAPQYQPLQAPQYQPLQGRPTPLITDEDLDMTAASDLADLNRPGNNYNFNDGFLVDDRRNLDNNGQPRRHINL
jgi:hypothetical protein